MSTKRQFRLPFDADLEDFLRTDSPGMVDYRILNQALDARGANRGKVPMVDYTVEVIRSGERFQAFKEEFHDLGAFENRPIIIGAGPAGLFCALRFAEYGIPCLLIERGERAHKRMIHIAKFWRYGVFHTENNVCYGEGGAGLFSDGKLITRIKSPFVQYVMNRMVDFGAPPETAYLSNPHLGSNKIRLLINKISDFLVSRGSEILYNTRVDELVTDEKDSSKIIGVKTQDGKIHYSDSVILATGHSAKEIYHQLEKQKIAMKPKDFAIGVRIEHPRELIDRLQYGDFAGLKLGAARYRLSYQDPTTEKGTYSFCMCPGGYVLSSGTDANGIVVNGMSNYARNSRWSNAALVVSVKAGEDFPAANILAGLDYQQDVEKKAYQVSLERASGKELPAQTLREFLDNSWRQRPLPKTSTPSGLVQAPLREILPNYVSTHLTKALEEFDRKMKGFVTDEALLIAPETRTSAPLTLLRDPHTFESLSHKGLYPCGEGAGHAGGITSAAVDGVKIAMSLILKYKNFEIQKKNP